MRPNGLERPVPSSVTAEEVELIFKEAAAVVETPALGSPTPQMLGALDWLSQGTAQKTKVWT